MFRLRVDRSGGVRVKTTDGHANYAALLAQVNTEPYNEAWYESMIDWTDVWRVCVSKTCLQVTSCSSASECAMTVRERKYTIDVATAPLVAKERTCYLHTSLPQ